MFGLLSFIPALGKQNAEIIFGYKIFRTLASGYLLPSTSHRDPYHEPNYLLLTVFLTERPSTTVFLSLVLMGILLSCASPRPLTGGEEDKAPPAIIEAESTPNKQVNFTGNEITITFDEWVVLKDIYSQLLVSPLMPDQPDIKQKGKAIIITLPDSLEESTTYSINFGNAITDLNEGNILENYSFVFSTGPVLDSISLNGRVTDAVNLQPAEGLWVMMHEAGVDSAIYKIKPAYVAKTNKEGRWTINNIREGSFEVFALKDANLNFLYDQDSELFGWMDSIVVTNQSATLPDIVVFPRRPKVIVQGVTHTVPGLLSFVIPGPQPKALPILTPNLDSVITFWDQDTLRMWYPPEIVYSGIAILGVDTTVIRNAKEPISAEKLKLTMVTSRLHPLDSVRFTARVPLVSIDTSKIRIMQDSLGDIPFTLKRDSLSPLAFSLHGRWKPLLRYHIALMPGALSDYWGRANDTLKHTFVVTQADQYGIFRLTITGLDSLNQYLFHILSGNKVQERFVFTGVDSTTITSAPLLPGKYLFELIEDENRNGMWDTGDYDRRIKPERKKFFTPDNLRAGWDLEAKLEW